jgi:hypothetical protein
LLILKELIGEYQAKRHQFFLIIFPPAVWCTHLRRPVPAEAEFCAPDEDAD